MARGLKPEAIKQSGLRGIIAWRGVDTVVDSSRPMPKATMATFTGAYPDAKQRRQTTDFLKAHGVSRVIGLTLAHGS